MTPLDDVLARLGALPDAAMATLRHDVTDRLRNVPWVPNLGPQTEAYFSLADLLLLHGWPFIARISSI